LDTTQINITEVITKTINTLFDNLFSSIDNNLYLILDDITFINSDIFNDKFFKNIFGTSSQNGILLVANSLLIGIVLYYIARLLYSHFLSIEIEKPIQFIFKLLFFGIIINCSFFLCEQFITLNSYLSSAIREIGENIFKINISFSQLIKSLNSTINISSTNFNVFSLDGIIKSFLSIELLNLVFSYSLRYILIKVFILITPFAILSLINQSTSWFFKTWFRSLFSLLIIQSFVSLILLITFSINSTNTNILNKLLYIGSLYAITKANFYIKELIGGISTNFSNNFNILKKTK
jgi:hypothetical protein